MDIASASHGNTESIYALVHQLFRHRRHERQTHSNLLVSIQSRCHEMSTPVLCRKAVADARQRYSAVPKSWADEVARLLTCAVCVPKLSILKPVYWDSPPGETAGGALTRGLSVAIRHTRGHRGRGHQSEGARARWERVAKSPLTPEGVLALLDGLYDGQADVTPEDIAEADLKAVRALLRTRRKAVFVGPQALGAPYDERTASDAPSLPTAKVALLLQLGRAFQDAKYAKSIGFANVPRSHDALVNIGRWLFSQSWQIPDDDLRVLFPDGAKQRICAYIGRAYMDGTAAPLQSADAFSLALAAERLCFGGGGLVAPLATPEENWYTAARALLRSGEWVGRLSWMVGRIKHLWRNGRYHTPQAWPLPDYIDRLVEELVATPATPACLPTG